MTTQEMVALGARYSSVGILHAADVILAGVDGQPAVFRKFKVDAAWSRKVTSRMAAIEKAQDDRTAVAGDILPTAQRYDAAIKSAKAWRSDALAYADLAFSEGAAQRAFHAGAIRTGHSVAALQRALGLLVPLTKSNAKALAAEGAPNGFASKGAVATKALAAAHKAHAAALATLTPRVRALHEAKGELWVLLKRATLVARKQHLGTAGQFSVSGLASAHRAKKAAAAATDAPGAAAPAVASAKPAQRRRRR